MVNYHEQWKSPSLEIFISPNSVSVFIETKSHSMIAGNTIKLSNFIKSSESIV